MQFNKITIKIINNVLWGIKNKIIKVFHSKIIKLMNNFSNFNKLKIAIMFSNNNNIDLIKIRRKEVLIKNLAVISV